MKLENILDVNQEASDVTKSIAKTIFVDIVNRDQFYKWSDRFNLIKEYAKELKSEDDLLYLRDVLFNADEFSQSTETNVKDRSDEYKENLSNSWKDAMYTIMDRYQTLSGTIPREFYFPSHEIETDITVKNTGSKPQPIHVLTDISSDSLVNDDETKQTGDCMTNETDRLSEQVEELTRRIADLNGDGKVSKWEKAKIACIGAGVGILATNLEAAIMTAGSALVTAVTPATQLSEIGVAAAGLAGSNIAAGAAGYATLAKGVAAKGLETIATGLANGPALYAAAAPLAVPALLATTGYLMITGDEGKKDLMSAAKNVGKATYGALSAVPYAMAGLPLDLGHAVMKTVRREQWEDSQYMPIARKTVGKGLEAIRDFVYDVKDHGISSALPVVKNWFEPVRNYFNKGNQSAYKS